MCVCLCVYFPCWRRAGLGPEITIWVLHGSGVSARDVAKAGRLRERKKDGGRAVERAREALSSYSGRRPKSPSDTLTTTRYQGCARTPVPFGRQECFPSNLQQTKSNFYATFPRLSLTVPNSLSLVSVPEHPSTGVLHLDSVKLSKAVFS